MQEPRAVTPSRVSAGLAWLSLLPALGVAAAQAVWPWPFFSDDAFVSLRYADRLLHGEGLTWTDGARVEGYSNLLWVLGCASLGALGLDLVLAARLLGACCTAAALWLLARALRPIDLRTATLAAGAPLLVATAGTTLAWTLGGLEGPMMLLWLAWGFGALARHLAASPEPQRWSARTLLACSAPFALGCWTRPDGPLWAAGAGLGLGIAALRGGLLPAARPVAWFALLPIAALAAQVAFRLAYYGEWVPNTTWVKAPFDPGSADGVHYVLNALWWQQGLAWPALLGLGALAAGRGTRHVAWTLALPLLLWFAYLVWIGGDHFPGHRLLHGALAPMALLAGAGCRCFAASWRATLSCAAGALAFAALGLWLSRTDPRSSEIRGETWEWSGKVVGAALARAFPGERPLLAVDAAGAVPFYSRLPALDMLGLCDRTVARTPYREWLHDVRARGEVQLPPGHLRGNGAYVMERRPDLMMFGPPPGRPVPLFVSALEFESDPRFLRGYRCALLDLGEHEIAPPHRESVVASLWVRLDGRAGVRADGERIEIPAWLFGAYTMPRPLMMKWLPPPPDSAEGAAVVAERGKAWQWYQERSAVAVPGPAGTLELELRGSTAGFRWPLAAGTWRLQVEPAGAAAASAAGCPPGPAPGTFVVAQDGETILELARPGEAVARVRCVVLVREP
jgi:hypothetical protein